MLLDRHPPSPDAQHAQPQYFERLTARAQAATAGQGVQCHTTGECRGLTQGRLGQLQGLPGSFVAGVGGAPLLARGKHLRFSRAGLGFHQPVNGLIEHMGRKFDLRGATAHRV